MLVLFPLLGGFVPTPSAGLVTHGPRRGRLVALTFDADPQGYDPRVVRELRSFHAPATVFLTGLFVRAHPNVVRALARQPDVELENHSFDHRAWESPCYGLPPVAGEAKTSEVVDAARLIARVAGARPRFFRFPGGCQDRADVRFVPALGEVPVQWDVASGDPYLHDPGAIVRRVLAEVRAGSIVVMHLNGPPHAPATAGALAALIPALRHRGFALVLLQRLLGTAQARPRSAVQAVTHGRRPHV